MKKILIVLALLAMATPSFAINITSDDGTSLGGGMFKPSKDVTVSFISSATAYAAGSKHKQGTKGFGATNIDPKLTEITDATCAAGSTMAVPADENTAPTACSGT